MSAEKVCIFPNTSTNKSTLHHFSLEMGMLLQKVIQ